MKLVYTEQALESIQEALSFIAPKVTHKKLIEIRDHLLNTADIWLQIFYYFKRIKGKWFLVKYEDIST